MYLHERGEDHLSLNSEADKHGLPSYAGEDLECFWRSGCCAEGYLRARGEDGFRLDQPGKRVRCTSILMEKMGSAIKTACG